jgi:serine-type D-Ala-D-Ala carboxypeptidase/endopeptidase
MRYGQVACIAFAFVALACPARAAAPDYSENNESVSASFFGSDADLQHIADSIVAGERVQGVVIGLLEPDGRRRIFTAGHAGAGRPSLSDNTVFEIASLTKTFTGTLLADAVLRGEVRLDDPVAKYLPPSVKMPSYNGQHVTLLDLATHRSGLPRIATGFTPPDQANPYATFDDAQLYRWLSNYQLERAPGDKAEYSNLGTGLLGHALARAAGVRDFPELVKIRILRPVGMRHSDFKRSRLKRWLATGHNEKGTAVSYWDVAALTGAGGLNSTAADMLAYIDANTGPPIKPIERAMRLAHEPRVEFVEDKRIGLGWQSSQQDGRTVVSHTGGSGGFSSAIAIDPQNGAGVIILTNSANFWRREEIAFYLLKGAVHGYPAYVPATSSSGK